MIDLLRSRFPQVEEIPGLEPTFRVVAADLRLLLDFLKTEPQCRFDLLSNLTAVDYPPDRIKLVYHLLSTSRKQRCCVQTETSRSDPKVPSVVPIFNTADFHEREAYDLFGVIFEGHPNLQRILTPEDMEGWPLRKDFTSPHLIPKPER